MNSAGLSSICQGTNGLNGSALRAIFSTFGPLLALGWVVAVCVPVGAHAPISSAATTAPMTGHRVFSEIIKSLLPDENDRGFQLVPSAASDDVGFATTSPRAALLLGSGLPDRSALSSGGPSKPRNQPQETSARHIQSAVQLRKIRCSWSSPLSARLMACSRSSWSCC